jgi:hypothetical protein
MTNSGNAEAQLIYSAYQDQVKEAFKGLFTNLQQMPANKLTEQQCVDRFNTGLKKAKRARDLALKAIVAPSTTDGPPKATAARRRQARES